ncbi:MAG: hypothetical protein DI628_04720 [Blastochloris viridis]|uniref:Uncharacterized protein n=1 Tax=Blastochloris viridis TaxID=1079 RepID=A0A6N4RF56_BLAVI|nr:MAG: hypothetical protein DI628_04720 [Blastochloris viridis]
MKKLLRLILCSIQDWMTDRRIAHAKRPKKERMQPRLPTASDTFFQAHLVKPSQAIDDPGVKTLRITHVHDVALPKTA